MATKKAKRTVGADAIRKRRDRARQVELTESADTRREESQAAYLAACLKLWRNPDRAAKAIGLRFTSNEHRERMVGLATELIERAESLSVADLHRVFLLTTSAILVDLMAAHAVGAVPQRELTNSLLRLQLSRKNLIPDGKLTEEPKPIVLVLDDATDSPTPTQVAG